MKKLLTAKELRKKYRPDEVLTAIQETFTQRREQIIELFSSQKCPLSRYKPRKQISLLETNNSTDRELAIEIADTLQDAVYFMILPKQERTQVTQRLRSFEAKIVENQLARIDLLLEDDQLGSTMLWAEKEVRRKGSTRRRGLEMAFEILRVIKSDLEAENRYWSNVSRSGYLTGLQMSMGEFFARLKAIGMNQKDQITIVQQLFDQFEVDWDEGDRENIKVSLQQPALDILANRKQEMRISTGVTISKYLSKEILQDLSDLSILYKKELRRF